jgi:NAD-reducing hydrogenase small subunit
VEIVYSPVASDTKVFPEGVDVCLVEGAVANADNLALAQRLRRCSRLVVSFGDCAVTGNVPALRNLWSDGEDAGRRAVLDRGYVELADRSGQHPSAPGIVPELLERVLPLHEVIPVDLYLPGCPPSAGRIQAAIEPLLRGERPVLQGPDMLRFG